MTPNVHISTAAEARDCAIEWQHWSTEDDRQLSMGELLEWQQFFEALTERFPELTDEFRENGIC